MSFRLRSCSSPYDGKFHGPLVKFAPAISDDVDSEPPRLLTILRLQGRRPSSIINHQLSLSFSSPASHAMTSVTSTFSSHSNFASVFNAALETYKRKTKKDLASLLPRLQSCNSSEAIFAVLREQFPTSMRADHQCRRVPCHLATVLTYYGTDAGGGLDKSARLGDAGYDPVVELDGLEKILGLSWHDREYRDREARRGVVWGLVVTGMGKGELMSVESITISGN